MQPAVVRTTPRSGDMQVDPAITEIRVTYSKDMMDGIRSSERALEADPTLGFLAKNSAKLLYGTIILAAVLGSLIDPLPRGPRVIVISLLSLYAISMADAYSRLINEDLKARRVTPLGESWTRILAPTWVRKMPRKKWLTASFRPP